MWSWTDYSRSLESLNMLRPELKLFVWNSTNDSSVYSSQEIFLTAWVWLKFCWTGKKLTNLQQKEWSIFSSLVISWPHLQNLMICPYLTYFFTCNLSQYCFNSFTWSCDLSPPPPYTDIPTPPKLMVWAVSYNFMSLCLLNFWHSCINSLLRNYTSWHETK